MKDAVALRGFFRIQIGEDLPDGGKEIKGDSGWLENEVVNLGFQDYICAAAGAVAGSKQISHAALGTGTAPGAAATSLHGEDTDAGRKTTSNSVSSSKTLQCTAEWASGDHPGGHRRGCTQS